MKGATNFDVYLPPSYTSTYNRRYPVVYMLHGINGSNVEWEVRNMQAIVDALIRDKGIAEMIVVFPNGASGWWVNSSAGNYRDMVVNELVPLVDRVYRTIPDRDHRGAERRLDGRARLVLDRARAPGAVQLAGEPHRRAELQPAAGTAAERAANAKFNPYTMVGAMTTEQLLQHTYYFDAGEQDDFGFYNAARQMDARLTAKNVPHEWQLGPGRHADAYWVPKLDRSFGLHTAQFNAHPVQQPRRAGDVGVGERRRRRARSRRRSSLVLGAPATFGAFTPGVARTLHGVDDRDRDLDRRVTPR